jgi:DNA-directed RNA polymerase alpha subunit
MPGTDLYDRLLKEGKLQDNSINVTNVPHKNITNQQVIEALQYANKKGFNFITNLKRSYFYFNILRRQKGNTVNDIIHKTLFALIVQWRFGKITKRETKKLSDKIALRKQ